MKTIPTKQTNEKQTIVHTFEPNEKGYPFSVLEEIETNEDGTTSSTFEPILGNYKLNEEKYETLEEVVNYVESKPYTLIISLITTTLDAKDRFEKEQQELLKLKQNETK